MHLLDINVWLALAFRVHAHHSSARAWFDPLPAGARCFFCRFTQHGFLRLANNPIIFPQLAVTQAQAWTLYDALVADSCVEFAPEPLQLELHWRQFTQGSQYSTKIWADAYLAAFARAADLELISFDKGFTQYTGLKHTILS